MPLSSILDPRASEAWPELPLEAWKDTYATLHRYTQIIGKVRLALAPPMNHWWQVPLYISSRGLTTSPIPYASGIFEVEFDFLEHALHFRTDSGGAQMLALEPRPVAEFYQDVMATLRTLGIEVHIRDVPTEIPDDLTPFSEDRHHVAYDAKYAQRWWRAMVSAYTVLTEFRARFTGKCSPVHFFWGSFDMAVTRFSGKRAPDKPEVDTVTREAYCEEVISAGFWPGTERVGGACFYCYAAPEPPGFSQASVMPAAAWYDTGFKQFLLRYDDVRSAPKPRARLLDFLQSTYEAGATLGGWDRARLERPLFLGQEETPGQSASSP